METAAENLAKILDVPGSLLEALDKKMSMVLGKNGVLDAVFEENKKEISATLKKLSCHSLDADYIRGVLRQTIVNHEKQLLKLLDTVSDSNEFGKMAILARKMTGANSGFFLKEDRARDVLLKNPPYNLMRYLGYGNLDDLLARESLMECFSALRFVETNEWMHETFDKAYGQFTSADFEERAVELRVLGPKWHDVAKDFVEKKHHNVSHLKEFGVIFLNPVREAMPGKLLRDFALLLHYFHEIRFYSLLFKEYFVREDFAERLKSLLRGDVNDAVSVERGEWLIVQRYLMKENPEDRRLGLPRVNPESMHWMRGERDFAKYVKQAGFEDLALWGGLDWVGGMFKGEKGEELVSFDLEDNVMSLVSFMEGKHEFLIYHEREALWTKIFSEYVGGEQEMEKMIIENFEKGTVKF